jgi:hypothetical protein
MVASEISRQIGAADAAQVAAERDAIIGSGLGRLVIALTLCRELCRVA